MSSPQLSRLLVAAVVVVHTGCASSAPGRRNEAVPIAVSPRSAPPATTPTEITQIASPEPERRVTAGLPPVPVVVGALLDIRVRYPTDNQLITSRDSNFVLGSIGTGDARLTINGTPVTVAANGAFLAWLPNPAVAPLRYDVVVSRGADTVRRTITVRVALRTPLKSDGRLRVDSNSLAPAGRGTSRPDELVRVGLRAPANAMVWLDGADGWRRPMIPLLRTQASALLANTIAPPAANGVRTDPLAPPPMPSGEDTGVVFATDVVARRLVSGASVVAERGADTVRLAVPEMHVNDPDVRVVGLLRTTSTVGSDTDRVVNARTVPDGTYKWLLFPGTALEITGRQGGSTRVHLDDALDVWVANEDIVTLPVGTALPRRVTGGLRLTPTAHYVDVSIPLGDRPAFLVEPDDKTLVLTLYGVQANPEISPILQNDTLVRRISWDQVSSDRVRITLSLSRPVFGWLALWDEGRRALVVRVRRPPAIDLVRPLAGLTIAVDPGHPPIGATGPTGLYEGDAVLPVGALVAQLLRARGATVVMTRLTLAAVGLPDRAVMARRADAHAFVSIHLNALPDGVNPFTANGTSTLFFHQHSEPLARPVQRELVARFGLRDLGVHYQNLAVARPTWYPSVLTEGLFLMLPEQEAAMRDAGFQLKYAEGIVAGLETYFRELGRP